MTRADVIDHLCAESVLAEAAARDAAWREDWAARDRYTTAAETLVDQAIVLLDRLEDHGDPCSCGEDHGGAERPRHVWAVLDDCRRCLHCECLPGDPEPCEGAL